MKGNTPLLYQYNTIGNEKLLELIGTGFISSKTAPQGILSVVNGKKKVYAAMQEGKKVFMAFKENDYFPYLNQAPGNKENIAVVFDYADSKLSEFNKRTLENNFEHLALMSGQLKVVNRSALNKVLNYQRIFKGESYMDAKNIPEQDMLSGADYLVTLKPGSIKYADMAESNILPINVKITEVKTGSILADETSSLRLTKIRANTYHCLKSPFNLNEILATAFNWSGQVKEIIESKKEKAKSVLISSQTPMEIFWKYKVYEVQFEEVNGKKLEREVEIGEVSIRENRSKFLAVAKVKDGEKEIFAAMQSGKKLICKRKKGLFQKLMDYEKKIINNSN